MDQDARIEELEKTVYKGNGKESLVTRIEVMEQKIKSWEKVAWIFLSTTILLIGTVVADAVSKHWK